VVVFSAALKTTPTPDPFNMLFVAAPIYLLYEVGIIFAKIAARRKNQKDKHLDDTPALEA
jgi:Sec-independent protein secretion pathway component TatC